MPCSQIGNFHQLDATVNRLSFVWTWLSAWEQTIWFPCEWLKKRRKKRRRKKDVIIKNNSCVRLKLCQLFFISEIGKNWTGKSAQIVSIHVFFLWVVYKSSEVTWPINNCPWGVAEYNRHTLGQFHPPSPPCLFINIGWCSLMGTSCKIPGQDWTLINLIAWLSDLFLCFPCQVYHK